MLLKHILYLVPDMSRPPLTLQFLYHSTVADGMGFRLMSVVVVAKVGSTFLVGS